jgi:hypothetical protein
MLACLREFRDQKVLYRILSYETFVAVCDDLKSRLDKIGLDEIHEDHCDLNESFWRHVPADMGPYQKPVNDPTMRQVDCVLYNAVVISPGAYCRTDARDIKFSPP